jgi:DNA polymerase III epsilon subunit-like protein
MDFVALDFETTGYEPGSSNDPWQLGIAVVRESRIVETKEWFFGTELTPDFEPMMAQWEDFYPYLADSPLVAHNIACEKTILTRIAPLTQWGPWTDTLKLAKKRYPRLGSYKLGDLCEMFGCVPQIEGRTWHDGLYDAVACAELALRLTA